VILMNVSITELAGARAAAEKLLESLGLEAYLYEIEPGDDGWTMVLECATDDGWQRLSWEVDKDELLQSLDDEKAKQRLAEQLSRQVGACRAR